MSSVTRRLSCFIITVALVFASASSHAQNWRRIAQFGGAPQYISVVYFVDDFVGFAGIYGTTNSPLKRTTDGGQSWLPCLIPPLSGPALFEDIWFRDAQNGWITFNYGATNHLWRTTDAGLTWNTVTAFPDVGGMTVRQTSRALTVTSAVSGNVASTGIYTSNNNGGSFQLLYADSNYAGMDFVDDLHGVAAGLYTRFSITNDGGLTWRYLANSPNTESFGVYGVTGSSTFFTAPEDVFNSSIKNILRSDDFGQTWTTLAVPPIRPTGDIKGVVTPNGTLLFIQTRYQNSVTGVMRSRDMGNSWESIGGPNNVNDTRLFVQQCGNRIFAADTDCQLWVTYNGGDGTHFSCNLEDSIQLTATLCDSLRAVRFLHNPHPTDSVSVIEARILDSTQGVVVSRAFGFDSLPSLSLLLRPHDSMGFILHWKPRRFSDAAFTSGSQIRFITYDRRTGTLDTIIIPVMLSALDIRAQFATPALLNLPGRACLALDTSIPIQNLGCDTLWLTADSLNQKLNWSIIDKNGNPPLLPLRLLPGERTLLPLRQRPLSSDLSDTVLLHFRYLRYDTTTLVYLAGKASARDPFDAPAYFHLDSVLMCATTDTLFLLADSLCGTMSITNLHSDSLQWAFFDSNRQPLSLPLSFSSNDHFPLRVEFTPSYLQETTDTVRLTYRYFDSSFTRNIRLRGSAKQTSGFDYLHVFDLGAHSTCVPFDTTLSLQNQTCAKAYINSIKVSAPFEILDTTPLTVDTNGNVRLHVRFSPKSALPYSSQGAFSFTEYELPATDTIRLLGNGILLPPTFTTSPLTNSITLNRSECEPLDTIRFAISNPSCDSLKVESMTLQGSASSILKASLDRPLPLSLAGPDSLFATVLTSNLTPGSYSGDLLFQVDGKEIDIPISLDIAREPRTMEMDISPIEFGALKACQTQSVAIPYTNTGCTLDSVTGWTLSDWSLGINVFGTGRYPPYALKAAETDTLHITFDDLHTGKIYDTVLVGFGTDVNPIRRIPIHASVAPVDSVLFRIVMPPNLSSDEVFDANVYPDRVVSGTGITAISGFVALPTNDFSYLSIHEGSGLTISTNGPITSGSTDRIEFALSNSNGISLNPQVPILTLKLRSLMTDSIAYTVALEDMVINPSDPAYSHCTLAAGSVKSSSRFDPHCGDSLFIQMLQNRTLLLATDPSPNPVMSENGSITRLTLRPATSGTASVRLVDALGRCVQQNEIALTGNAAMEYTVDFTNKPSGTYTLAIQYHASNSESMILKQILLIR